MIINTSVSSIPSTSKRHFQRVMPTENKEPHSLLGSGIRGVVVQQQQREAGTRTSVRQPVAAPSRQANYKVNKKEQSRLNVANLQANNLTPDPSQDILQRILNPYQHLQDTGYRSPHPFTIHRSRDESLDHDTQIVDYTVSLAAQLKRQNT